MSTKPLSPNDISLHRPRRRGTTTSELVPSKSISKAPPLREQRVLHQPSFVLHSIPYKETSLIVEVFSREFGRLSLVAKGAKRPHSALRGALQTFQPLNVSWTGKGEVKTLTDAEWVGGMQPLEKSALLCGFYLNELLMRFLLRSEVNVVLFDLYVSTLNQLAHNEMASIVLRQFEITLLKQSGFLGSLHQCAQTKSEVISDTYYVIDPLHGVRPFAENDRLPAVLGKTLQDMEREDYSDSVTQNQSKQLTRFLLNHHLHGQALNTRQILIDLQKL